MNPALLITAAGPILGAIGLYGGIDWLFWSGIVIALLALFLNLASGILKAPVLPGLCVVVGAAAITPWYHGAGVGLLVWTALETAGEIVGLRKEGRL
tara:strand:- start:325 stop:615 length:291 start_codon:yes stop_codon:yes gene_type:complete